MLTNKRHEQILKLLQSRGSVTLQELKDELTDTSESTIRRDLTQLHEKGLLTKVFGGAVAVESLRQSDELLSSRQIQNMAEKQLVAAFAGSLVRKNYLVYLDAGTTTECMIPYLPQGATYVTNAPGHAQKMCQRGLNVILLGGLLKASTEAVVGAITCRQLESYNFNLAFLGTNGVSTHAGLSTPDPEEAQVKNRVVHRTINTYVVCDHSKFHKISPVTFADLEDVIVLVDSIPEGPFREIPNVVDVTKEEQT